MSGQLSQGKQVQELIYDWLRRVYPDGPQWGDADFHCFAGTPIEIKMIPAFDVIEPNIENGGWSQVLWNCFVNWRELIQIAREGYRLIGASAQVSALDELYAVCARDEEECRRARARAIQGTDEEAERCFSEFTNRSYGKGRGYDWEALFFTDSGLYAQRLAWLAANEGRIRKAVGVLHS